MHVKHTFVFVFVQGSVWPLTPLLFISSNTQIHPINPCSPSSSLCRVYNFIISTSTLSRSLNLSLSQLSFCVRGGQCLLGNEGLWAYQSYLNSLKGPLIRTNTHRCSHTHFHTPICLCTSCHRKRWSDRRKEWASGREAEKRKVMVGEEQWGEGGAGRRGASVVNVNGVSPGPERRVSDRRTMATGSIQKHSCCECMSGSVYCLAISRHL